MIDVTICTVVLNAVYAAALMWESYLKHHSKPQLFVYDQGSTDGALEYFQDKADLLLTGVNLEHGLRLDQLCKLVETKYTLVVDTDIEFKGNLYKGVNINENTFVVSETKNWGGQMGETTLFAQPTFQINCALFNTIMLQHVLKYFSFSSFSNGSGNKFYDTASAIWHLSQAANFEYIVHPRFHKVVKHYGGITGALYTNIYPTLYEMKTNEYETIKQRLSEIRIKQIPLI